MSNETFEHVSPEFRHLVSASTAVRARHITSDRYVGHHRAEQIIDHVEYLMLQPTQSRAWGLVVVGTPGSGKSALCAAIGRRLAPRFDVDGDIPRMPVITISMTNARDARAVYSRIFDQLGVEISSKLRRDDEELLAMRLLRKAETKVLLVDEVQDVLSSTKYQQRLALDTIKLIMNKLGIPIIAFGVENAAEALNADPHLRARFDFKALPTWKSDNDTQALLAAVEGTLPLSKPSNLASPTLTKEIVARANGNLSRLIRLVTHAAVYSILDGREKVDAAMLGLAAEGPPPPSVFRALKPEREDKE